MTDRILVVWRRLATEMHVAVGLEQAHRTEAVVVDVLATEPTDGAECTGAGSALPIEASRTSRHQKYQGRAKRPAQAHPMMAWEGSSCAPVLL